jgi:hypothetical protein
MKNDMFGSKMGGDIISVEIFILGSSVVWNSE